MQRRDFLKSVVATSAALALSRGKAMADNGNAQIEVFVDEPLGTISPNIYGQFTEHIGGVIYDGVWVGENSKIPNVHGIRKALIDRLKEIHVPVIRWPGGCFADSYDWKDGVGPAAQRPARTNFWEVDPDARRLHEKGLQIFDTNAFGTDEFVRFCKLTGAEPYFAANLRSLPALDFDHWVEYCNSPAHSTTLAQLRASSGSPEPYNVRYWGVGNESWGCGGNFQPEDYASELRRFTTWVPEYGENLQFIGSGPNGDDGDWTRRFFQELTTGHAYKNPHFTGWSVHHYSRVRGHDDALQFGETEWYELFRSGDRIEQIVADQWAILGEYDPEHRVKLVVDEYGPWHQEGTEVDPTHIFGEQITVRNAIVTALTLDCFNRNPEKVSMACNAQLVNNINALFLAHEDKFVVTPNFHIFSMYAAHQGGRAVHASFVAPEIRFTAAGTQQSFWGLKGSASTKAGTLTLTVVNPHISESRDTQIVIRGGSARSAAATILTNRDIHAHNTFDEPNTVSPASTSVAVKGGILKFSFPAASVSRLQIELM